MQSWHVACFQAGVLTIAGSFKTKAKAKSLKAKAKARSLKDNSMAKARDQG